MIARSLKSLFYTSAAEEVKKTDALTEKMESSTRSKDTGSAERTTQKRKMPSPSPSSNGHSSADTSPGPVKKKKRKPGAVSSGKDQSELRHGPFYYAKQPALTSDPVDVVPQDGRNDFYCWLCHREGQVLCCELCPRVYHAKCLKLPDEPEGDWFCPECEKITVAECIETQSKAMTMLTIEQLSYLLKFALQKMKQPGDHPRLSSRSPHAASTQRKTFNWTELFHKPVSLDQHPDYAEYIFHPMDLCTLEKNIQKKMYGCTEAFSADVKWILHNCIIYNGGNHKLTATAKVIVKICEHEMNEIEICPECYLSACQKRDNWFCEPCPKLCATRTDRWTLASSVSMTEIPFSVKKTKSIFNSAMQEMEVYVENMRKKFGVFNYAPFRTPYAQDNSFQMLRDPSDPSSAPFKPEKQEKIKLSFDMTPSPKISQARTALSGAGVGIAAARRLPLADVPRSPMSTNSSAHTGSDGEDATDKTCPDSQGSIGVEPADSAVSPAHPRPSQDEHLVDSPKPAHSQAPGNTKQEKTHLTGSILNLNLDRSKAEMDLKELSETVLQKLGAAPVLTSPKRQIKSRFQMNLDKTIESCKAQLGINEISSEVYKGVEHSDSEDSEAKSDSSDSEYASDEGAKVEDSQDSAPTEEPRNESRDQDRSSPAQASKADPPAAADVSAMPSAMPAQEKIPEKESPEKTGPPAPLPVSQEKGQVKEDTKQNAPADDSDSEGQLVIDLGEEQAKRDKKGRKKDSANAKEPSAAKPEGKSLTPPTFPSQNSTTPSTPSSVASQSPLAIPVTVTSLAAPSAANVSLATVSAAPATPPCSSSSAASATPGLKKQRPLLPREPLAGAQSAAKLQNPSPKWHACQQRGQQPLAAAQIQAALPRRGATQASDAGAASVSSSSAQQSSQSARYQTRQSIKAVPLVSGCPPSASGFDTSSASSSMETEGSISTASADVAADIAKYTDKVMDAIKGTVTEIYSDLSKSTPGNTIAEMKRLRIEIEKLQWLHQQELSEMKHNLELTMAEMRQSLEQEQERLVAEAKKQMELEKQQGVDETKKKQWCASCRKEAIFYCCWNTSYCDYPCQQAHWPEHMKSCTQSAAAPQQEAEAEPAADLSNKGAGQATCGPNALREAPLSASSNTDRETESCGDSAAVASSQLGAT
ncbi:protein kinase C-binding protein 1-like isoform X10 [Hippocampus comes]|uniref:protein kinase C-binding protein 1-like isoform X10 n=1 Tax=Hippocampus comes TaxID=109280 RepID=UPI00094EB2F0|nr:PREDICTED: protein kinase C-binding protein 1-like isoform X10 [Hippocampus comes]